MNIDTISLTEKQRRDLILRLSKSYKTKYPADWYVASKRAQRLRTGRKTKFAEVEQGTIIERQILEMPTGLLGKIKIIFPDFLNRADKGDRENEVRWIFQVFPEFKVSEAY